MARRELSSRMWKDVLLVSPDSTSSKQSSEIRDISEALRPATLIGEVTLQAVTDALSRQAWDIIWFAGHGGRESLYLSGTDVLNTSTLIQLVKASGARLVVLNTCESEQTAAWIFLQTGSTVICTISEVDDSSAYVTAVLLARALASGQDIDSAYNQSRPGEVGQANRYRIFNRTYTPGQAVTQLMEALALVQQPIMDYLSNLSKEVREVKGDLESLSGRVDDLSSRAVTYSIGQRMSWVLGALMYAAPFLASGLANLFMHGIEWVPFAVLGAVWVLLSVSFLMYGLGFFNGQ